MGQGDVHRSGDVERRLYLRLMTYDELAIGRLDLLRAIAVSPYRDANTRGAAAAGAAEIEAQIRRQAARRPCLDHTAGHEALPSTRNAPDYVPALTPEGEHDSLDTLRLMARRAALWERADIVALIAHPAPMTTADDVTAASAGSMAPRSG